MGPEFERFEQLYQQLYAVHPTGGPLHVVLDDWNIEGEYLEVYRDGIDEASLAVADEIIRIMRGWSEGQRAAALWKMQIAPREGVS